MKEDQKRFLSLLGQLPALLTAEQAGWVLNCQPHDIPALVNARLLKPPGNPSANASQNRQADMPAYTEVGRSVNGSRYDRSARLELSATTKGFSKIKTSLILL